MEKYVTEGLRRSEISHIIHGVLEFWIGKCVFPKLIAVKQELQGPGKLLGYWAIQKVIRQKHNLLVTHYAIYDVMTEVGSSGL